jgi:endonuclease/exonuclease/phosphatase family metal-dependent hydrolase
MDNVTALKGYYNNILKTKKFSKLFIIGDLNLPDLAVQEWKAGQSRNAISQAFLEMFNDQGLTQCVEQPTHRHRNILDVLLTNSPQTLSNLVVGEENSFCASDHFPISFSVKANVRRNRPVKRQMYNFKKAD